MPENCAAIVIAAKHHELTKIKDTRGTTQTVGALRCRFEFRTNDWLNSAKTAMFCNGNALLHPEVISTAIAVPLDSDDECAVPYEVLTDTLPYSVGVWGVTGNGLRIVSKWLVFEAQEGCYTEGSAPSEPEPTIYEQILTISQSAVDAANEVTDRANSGEFKGDSAYQVAIDNGYEGSEKEWLESLIGPTGRDGLSITKSEVNVNGELVLTYSDGNTNNVGRVIGANGIGIIKSEINSSGELVITYSNNQIINLGSVIGAKGEKGDKGDTGAKGDQGDKGDNYILTEADKQEIASLVEIPEDTDSVSKEYVDEELSKLNSKLSSVYKFKGTVGTYSELTDISNPEIGDVYNVAYDDMNSVEGNNYAWTGENWDSLGASFDLSYYVTRDELSNRQFADKDFVVDYVDNNSVNEDWVNENYLDRGEYSSIIGEANNYTDRQVSNLETQLNQKVDSTVLNSYITKDILDKELYTTVEIPSEYILGFSSYTGENLEFYTGTHPISRIYGQIINIDNLGYVAVDVEIYDIIEIAGASQVYIEFGENDEYGDPQVIKLIIIKRKYSNTIITEYFNNNTYELTIRDNVEYIASEPISDLSVNTVPYLGPYTCSIIFTISDIDEYNIEIYGDPVKYIGGAPDFKPGETWELNIRNGIVVAGKVEEA